MLPSVDASPLVENQQRSVTGKDQTEGREEGGELGGFRLCVCDPLETLEYAMDSG